MENKIDRKQDESLYQPKIHSERIRALYQLKQVTGKPMTVLVDQAIQEFAASYNTEYREEEPIEPVRQVETWEEFCEYRAFLDRLDYLKCLVELEKIKGEVKPDVSNLTKND
jgi:hypothetical protein